MMKPFFVLKLNKESIWLFYAFSWCKNTGGFEWKSGGELSSSIFLFRGCFVAFGARFRSYLYVWKASLGIRKTPVILLMVTSFTRKHSATTERAETVSDGFGPLALCWYSIGVSVYVWANLFFFASGAISKGYQNPSKMQIQDWTGRQLAKQLPWKSGS